MKSRWVIFILFLVAVGTLGYYRCPPLPAHEAVWKATMRLQKNTRLSPLHLKRPDLPTPASAWNLPELASLTGKYVLGDIKEGAKVTADQLDDAPHISYVKDTTLIFFDAKDLLSAGDQLNAGTRLYVCNIEKSCEPQPYTVEAVLGKNAPYTVVLRVPTTEVNDLLKIVKVQLRLAALP